MASSNIGKPGVMGIAIRCMAAIYPRLSILPLAAPAWPVDDGNMTSNGTPVDTRSRVLSWIALGVVYLVWGSTYLAIRVGVGHLPPLLFAGTRYVIAGALLYPIALRATPSSRGSTKDRAKPGARAWFAGAVIGVLLLFAGNGGVTIGETTLPSGFAAVLVATVPLWMILFAWPVQHQRVTFRSAAALAVGLGGVIILVGDGTASGRISGVIIVLGAAAAWGFGSVLSHRLAVPSHAMLAAAIEMLAGGVVLLAVGAGSGEFSRIQWSSVPATSWIALGYLIGPGSILAFTAYGYALSHLPVTTVSTYAYVNPVVAVLAGIMFLGEQFTWREGLGAALVLVSVIITLQRSRSTSHPAPVRDGDMPAPEMLPGERKAAQPALAVRHVRAPTPVRSQAGAVPCPAAARSAALAATAPGQLIRSAGTRSSSRWQGDTKVVGSSASQAAARVSSSSS
jgi:drug/metabolite transporter (DMT)-like permease